MRSFDTQLPSADDIRLSLRLILDSPTFRNSARLSRFLRFIVEQTLDNPRQGLKESVVGFQVFDRPPDYDPKLDSIVRVQARQLRAKLQEYYSGQGVQDQIRFELPKGAYTPVIRIVAPTTTPATAASPEAWNPIADLAVLPFANMSSDPENDHLSDGISEEILTALAQVRGLRLIARTSSFQFKGRNQDVRDIARQLGARNILEGSLRRLGSHLRITAQLITGMDGTHLWAEAFDAMLTEPAQLFAIQEDIAREISQRLGKVAMPAAPAETAGLPSRVSSYEMHLRARHWLRELKPDMVFKAIALLEQVIVDDPNYAAAYATLGACYGHLGLFGGPAGLGAAAKVKYYATEAIRRDPRLADGHILLGNAASALELDLASARTHYERALELDPQNAYARQCRAMWLLGPTGETEQAVSEIEDLLQLDPLSPELRHTYLSVLTFARRFDKVIEQASLLIQWMPQSFAAYFQRSLAYEALGDTERALADTKAEARCLPGMLIEEHVSALELHGAGRHSEAIAIAKQMEQDPRARFLPTVLADLWRKLGDPERAITWLEKAYEWRTFRVLWLGVDATYDSLRGMERFEALRRKVLGDSSL